MAKNDLKINNFISVNNYNNKCHINIIFVVSRLNLLP